MEQITISVPLPRDNLPDLAERLLDSLIRILFLICNMSNATVSVDAYCKIDQLR